MFDFLNVARCFTDERSSKTRTYSVSSGILNQSESPEVVTVNCDKAVVTSRAADMDQLASNGQQEHCPPKCEMASLAKKSGRFRHASGECLRHHSGKIHVPCYRLSRGERFTSSLSNVVERGKGGEDAVRECMNSS